MDYQWALNGTPLASLGLKIAEGNFRTHGVSSLKLQRASDFDAAELLAYGSAARITYDLGSGPVVFFSGKVASVPKFGSGSAEGQDYLIEDAWSDLENTIYQEDWKVPGAVVAIPRAVFGMSSAGAKITVGAMAAQVATACLPDLTIDVPVTGEYPIPSEITNQTGAEILAECLRLHPDWIPWIDHSTAVSPDYESTFRISALSSATTLDFAVDGSADVANFSVAKREDLLPDAVRIVYETAAEVDGEVYRKLYLDKYPTTGPDSGPRVIQAFITLAGGNVQIQKARTYCETIPTDLGDTAKNWLKKKCPQLKDLPNSHFDMAMSKEVAAEPSDMDDEPISAQARRLSVSSVDDLPRELLKGSIEDWMRLKVGKVVIGVSIAANDDTTAEEQKLMGDLTPICVTGTNAPAGAKLHKGVTSWTPAASIPSGVAQALYQAIQAGAAWEGSVTVTAEEIPVYPILGRKINLTGGVSAWASMGAPIHAMDWDIATGTATISFGPPKHLSPADFLELQRALRRREPRWFETDERGSDTLGSASGVSASGDTVGGYDFPNDAPGSVFGGASAYLVISRQIVAADGTITLAEGEYYSMFFQGGRLIWTHDSSSAATEPDVPEGTPAIYATALEAEA